MNVSGRSHTAKLREYTNIDSVTSREANHGSLTAAVRRCQSSVRASDHSRGIRTSSWPADQAKLRCYVDYAASVPWPAIMRWKWLLLQHLRYLST